jgi:hypothetical protein
VIEWYNLVTDKVFSAGLYRPAIFAHCRRKNWRFLKNQCYEQILIYFSFVLSQNADFLPIFLAIF